VVEKAKKGGEVSEGMGEERERRAGGVALSVYGKYQGGKAQIKVAPRPLALFLYT